MSPPTNKQRIVDLKYNNGRREVISCINISVKYASLLQLMPSLVCT